MLGWPEIVLIFVVLLLLFGPSKLPEIARTIGEATREFRKATSEIERTLQNQPVIDDSSRNTGYVNAQPPSIVGESKAVPPEAVKVASETSTDADAGSDLAEIAETLGIDTRGKPESEVRGEILEKVKALSRKENKV